MKRSLLPVAVVAALAAGGGCAPEDHAPERETPTISLMDVSPIWPLPDDASSTQSYLHASDEGDHGPVLSRALFDSLQALTRTDEPDTLYEHLLVTAARIDPCFQDGLDNPPCQPQIRVVLQSVLPPLDGDGDAEARDASIHVFYAADDEDEVAQLAGVLARARADAGAAGNAPLGLHPLLDDDDGRSLVKDILLPHLGDARVARVTSLGVHASNEAWTFAGGLSANADFEQHLLSDGGSGPIHASVIPAITDTDDITLLLDDATARAATQQERQNAYDAAARIEHPALHNPGTTTCVSCHMAAVARTTARMREELAPSPDEYGSTRHDLSVRTDFSNTALVHVLGYRQRTLAVAPRVIHESAESADRIDAVFHSVD